MDKHEAHYRVVLAHKFGADRVFKIMCDARSVWPWCVEYHGNGHYFMSAREALAYAEGRGWINFGQRETLAAEIEEGEWIDTY